MAVQIPQKLVLATVLGGAAVATQALLFTARHEGVSLTPYRDSVAKEVATVCFGETKVPMRRYTLPECQAMLSDSLAGYADAVRNLTPGFDSLTAGQKIAIVDLVYNVGISRYRQVPIHDKSRNVIGSRPSTIRTLYSEKRFPAACEQFLAYKWAGDFDCSLASNSKICGGIWRRRHAERAACRGE